MLFGGRANLKPMSTILILNAISSLVAGAGIAGLWLRARRAATRSAAVRPLYVSD